VSFHQPKQLVKFVLLFLSPLLYRCWFTAGTQWLQSKDCPTYIHPPSPVFQSMVPLKHNIALARMSQFARDWIITKKRGVALISLASIHPCKCFSNTRKQNGCHTPFIGDYSITSKSTCASECDIALEQYCSSIDCRCASLTIIVHLLFCITGGKKLKLKCNGHYVISVIDSWGAHVGCCD